MNNDFNSTVQRFSHRRLNAKRGRSSFSFIAVEEEAPTPFSPDMVGARRLQFVRIEQEAGSPSRFARPQEKRAPAMPKPRRDLLQPRLPYEFECQLEGKNVHVRAITKIVRDGVGNFYERRGQQLRPLGELALDEAGRVFEICPAGETKSNPPAPKEANGQAVRAARDECVNGKGQEAEPPQPNHVNGCTNPTPPEEPNTCQPPVYQKFFADPGMRLQLAFGRIKREIAGQLQHPERLQENDVVECYAQFYEAHLPLPVAQIAAAELGNAAFQSQLYFLTKGKAQLLGVPQLFKPASQPFATEATARRLSPYQCVYRLQPIFDPTVVPKPKTISPVLETPKELKREVPAPFLNPAQFKYSREEVLYDMQATLGTLPPKCGTLKRWLWVYPLRLLKTLFIVLATKNQVKKWRVMLAGKNLDEQIWVVTPPYGFAYHLSVRQWAEETLLRAGYDAEQMLLEWEIFWRRRER